MKRKTEKPKQQNVTTSKPVKTVRSVIEILHDITLDIRPKNETQKKLVHAIRLNDVTVCSGPAGCGKTFLSCFQSINELKRDGNNINKIVLVKSVITLKYEELGFLKGTLEEKMEPFMYSFMKNFEKIIGKEKTDLLKKTNTIEILPIAYMRGINIDNAIVIIDEAQNISIENIRTILTRLGENSKMIFLGDTKQIDNKNKQDSALKFLLANFKNVDGIGIVEFDKDDIIRHQLIKKIEEVFDSANENSVVLKGKDKTTINSKRNKTNNLLKIKLFFNNMFSRLRQ